MVTYFFYRYMIILYPQQGVSKLIQLMVMSCKKCFRFVLRMIVQVFCNSPRNGNAVIGTSAAANLVQQNQATVRQVMQDACRFIHLHHKSRFAERNIIRAAYGRENFSSGDSTFMVEMNETASILHNLSDR